MVDCRGEHLPRLVQAAAGIEHVIDPRSVFHPFLDLVEIAMVRDQRIAGFLFAVVFGSYFGGRRRMSTFSTPCVSK